MGYSWKFFRRSMSRYTWRWLLGLSYIFAVAIIWIAASYTVQSVVDAGVSPFLVTYICNSLFLIYIPLIEFGRCIMGSDKKHITDLHGLGSLENVNLLQDIKHNSSSANPSNSENGELSCTIENCVSGDQGMTLFDGDSKKVVEERIWTRFRLAKISLFVSPFWFIGQLTFNLSLKYTTVTSNTVLSSASSLFTFLVSLAFFGEKFTLIKLISVILCMGGTILVSLSDSSTSVNAVATNPLVGDILALVSAGLYAVYINIIREKLPDDIDGGGQASTAQFLGYLGFFNLLIFLPVAIVLDFGNLEPFHMLTWKQFGLIVSKGLYSSQTVYFVFQSITISVLIVKIEGCNLCFSSNHKVTFPILCIPCEHLVNLNIAFSLLVLLLKWPFGGCLVGAMNIHECIVRLFSLALI
ncbi:hypothetical protein HPP92_026323 [Vanilla planifolia]|uniref:EamA domain-containing protein n=1 Tax=Vanilla planifolia TaxID=51239 RepID=A0A835PDZ7_VANPL|nr:hypothetical protein HPP92_026323 [Vanilla planifolia]